MIKNIKMWQIELVMDVSVLVLAFTSGTWGICAAYFAVGYFGQKLVTYLENN